MGTYTRVKINLSLGKGTPPKVIEVLDQVVNKKDIGIGDAVIFKTAPNPGIDHPFFESQRWYHLLIGNNFDDNLGSTFKFSKNHWELDINSEFKCHDCEIEKFIDWITPYVAGRKRKQYVGWFKAEHLDFRLNIYVERRFENNSLIESTTLFTADNKPA